MRMYEDLPARKEEDVEPLTVPGCSPPKEEKPAPEAGKQTPLTDDERKQRGSEPESSSPVEESVTLGKEITIQPYFRSG